MVILFTRGERTIEEIAITAIYLSMSLAETAAYKNSDNKKV